MEYLQYLVVFLVSPVVLWLIFKRPKNLPPGPFPLPIIGNLHNLSKSVAPHKSMADLAKVHGPLMTLKLGSLTTVVVSSSSMAQQILQKHDLVFSTRWVSDAARSHRHHEFSLAYLPPNLAWRNIRKICNGQLFSSRRLDASLPLRMEKVEELIAHIHGCSNSGVSVNIGQVVYSMNLVLICKTLFSMDFNDDPNSTFYREFNATIRQVMSLLGEPNIVDFFPVLKCLDPQRIRRRMDKHFLKMIDLIQKFIDERLAKGIDPSTESSDVLDVLLKIYQENEDDHFGMPYIIHSLLDLLLGATETTSSTVEWAMTELLRDRNKLMKAREELELVIGKGNLVKAEDVTRLPYLRAIVKETLRLHPPLPLLVPRSASSDVVVCGFNVPKDTQVLVNIWAIGRDPSVWESPICFEPERFLGSEIDFKGMHFELTPFGAGRRYCPGLPYAYRSLHLILGSLIHSFDWKLEEGVEPETIDMAEKVGLAVHKATPLLAVPVSV